MIEFTRSLSEAEVRSFYLNLSDEKGKSYGGDFPPHKTKLIVIDGKDRITFASKHHVNQIWGTLRNWFSDNDVQTGAMVTIRFEKNETKDGYPVIHLISRQSISSPTTSLQSLATEQIRESLENIAYEIPISLEKQIEDFLAANLVLVEKGLKLYADENGEGRQYPTDVGVIDLLCQRSNGDFLVIELKRGRYSDVVVGQISRYIGWVKKNLSGEKAVYGLILVHDPDDTLEYAVMANDKLTLRYFRLRLELISREEAMQESNR